VTYEPRRSQWGRAAALKTTEYRKRSDTQKWKTTNRHQHKRTLQHALIQLFNSHKESVAPTERRGECSWQRLLIVGGGLTHSCFQVSFWGGIRKFPETKLEICRSWECVFGAAFNGGIIGPPKLSQRMDFSSLRSVYTYLKTSRG
jgi:hypothetical protein